MEGEVTPNTPSPERPYPYSLSVPTVGPAWKEGLGAK